MQCDDMPNSLGSVAMFNHPIVSLKFLEVCVRMGRFFKAQPGCLPVVLNAFIGEAGINNSGGHVRSRASYWFLRFVKDSVKVQGRDLLQPYMGDILGALQPVCMSEPGTFSEEDQLFLFESLGYLVTSMAQPQDQYVIGYPSWLLLSTFSGKHQRPEHVVVRVARGVVPRRACC